MEEIIKEVIASAIGALIGGLFTILGVRMTLAYERSKERKQEAKDKKEKDEIYFKNRPRLEILSYKEIAPYKPNKKADAVILLAGIQNFKSNEFYYHDDITNQDKWVAVEYVFKNTGNTEIDHIYFSANLVKNISLFNVLTNENVAYYEAKGLNYNVFVEKTIKPKETIRVQICYANENKIIVSNIASAPITAWLVDENKNWWSQAIFAPERKIYNSEKASHKEWRENTDETTAIKCFNNPMLW